MQIVGQEHNKPRRVRGRFVQRNFTRTSVVSLQRRKVCVVVVGNRKATPEVHGGDAQYLFKFYSKGTKSIHENVED